MSEPDHPPVEPEDQATDSGAAEPSEPAAVAESSQPDGPVSELPPLQPGVQLPLERAGAARRRGCLLAGLAAWSVR
ncbi:hypothetical protein [Candidatus Poriferisodalis sp.]|uniref:hypothetical protein n=1 Tax=Candidatus Poriferisodalis sp. TaxID=3101277 RepID=UPI003B01F3A8